MDFIIEFVFELLFSAGTSAVDDRPLNKGGRYLVIGFIAILYIFVFGILIVGGIVCVSDHLAGSVLLFALAVFLLIRTWISIRRKLKKSR